MQGHIGQTIELREDQRPAFIVEMLDRSLVGRCYFKNRRVLPYFGYDFDAEIHRLLLKKGFVSTGCELAKLHEVVDPVLMDLGDDEQNEISRSFYETDDEFLTFYRKFIKDFVPHYFGCSLYFQAVPTFRFHFPFEKGFDWEPRYHTDIMLGHPPHEVNVWLPITRAFGTNTMRIAGRKDSMNVIKACGYDFEKLATYAQGDEFFQNMCFQISEPAELEIGELLVFDSRCLHATQKNTTTATRVSMDFRVIPVDEYKNSKIAYRGTGRRKMPFAPGEFYDSSPV